MDGWMDGWVRKSTWICFCNIYIETLYDFVLHAINIYGHFDKL